MLFISFSMRASLFSNSERRVSFTMCSCKRHKARGQGMSCWVCARACRMCILKETVPHQRSAMQLVEDLLRADDPEPVRREAVVQEQLQLFAFVWKPHGRERHVTSGLPHGCPLLWRPILHGPACTHAWLPDR